MLGSDAGSRDSRACVPPLRLDAAPNEGRNIARLHDVVRHSGRGCPAGTMRPTDLSARGTEWGPFCDATVSSEYAY